MRVLVVDIGGSNVKLKLRGKDPLRFRSGKHLTPELFVRELELITGQWRYDRLSIGFPGVVKRDRVMVDPVNLGPGWVGFDFARAFRKRVRVINDAAMQALGSATRPGITLFLGMGTGLGVSLVVDGHVVPTELGEAHVHTVSKAALKRHGKRRWVDAVKNAVIDFDRNLHPDWIVIGGGNVELLKPFRRHFGHRSIVAGSNDRAFVGGVKLWSPVTHRVSRR